MKSLYLECNMGIAGDMLCAALLDLMNEEQRNNAVEKVNTFIDGACVSVDKTEKCGIVGTKFDVNVTELGHSHSSISEIFEIIDTFDIPDEVKLNARTVYEIIADAESVVHGKAVADIHFHEVGAKDAVIDVTTACYLIYLLGVEKIIASTVTTGFGEVDSAHGIIPVPAPATIEILKGVPLKTGDIRGELCTPTGAGLLKYFCDDFTDNVEFVAEKIGYGMGTRDFDRPNCLRAVLFNNEQYVYELRCQIDDMTGEEMGYAINKLLSLGALDVFAQDIVMKKSRPAYALTVISRCDKKDYLTGQIFKHTTTLGVRQVKCVRRELDRELVEVNGVTVKKSSGFGVEKQKAEFEELAKFADENDVSIFDAKKMLGI